MIKIAFTEEDIKALNQDGGIEKLKEINFYRPESKLSEHKEELASLLTPNFQSFNKSQFMNS